jgi:DNA-binding IclR family transcriptional regulator
LAHIGLARTSSSDLRVALRQSLEHLRGEVDETCHLVVLEGNGARFLDCVESTQILRTGSRVGMLLPAHTNSAGKALLAELSPKAFLSLYPRGVPSTVGGGIAARKALQRQLAQVRSAGYATNFEESAQGVTAVGACVRDGAGKAVAALAIASPSSRCDPRRVTALAEVLLAQCAAVHDTLSAAHKVVPIGRQGSSQDWRRPGQDQQAGIA